MLGDNYFRNVGIFSILVIDLVTINEQYHVCILLNASTFTQITQRRAFVLALLDGNAEALVETLQAAKQARVDEAK